MQRVAVLALLMPGLAGAAPQRVEFASADGATTLTGYVFEASERGRHPAIVMLHGRSGVYSSLNNGVYDATSLSARHLAWGEFWAQRGYIALLVDSFGPRGYAAGFGVHSYAARPATVSEQHVRPLDAYGALAYLGTRQDVDSRRVALQGWSNGGMTVLSAMDARAAVSKSSNGFRAALAFYPSCRTQEKEPSYSPYAPLLILSGSDDAEVSTQICRRFARAAHARGAPVEFVLYEGAQHAYDDPGAAKQRHEPNRLATTDSRARAQAFLMRHLER